MTVKKSFLPQATPDSTAANETPKSPVEEEAIVLSPQRRLFELEEEVMLSAPVYTCVTLPILYAEVPTFHCFPDVTHAPTGAGRGASEQGEAHRTFFV